MDQVAVFNYVLIHTKQEKVSYVAHSAGATQLLAGGALKPQFFNKKINIAILLAPPASILDVNV